MLTRLRVAGFKNLVDVDVRFGPFTCVAGANGVGKSNLFDAIRLLSNLADLPLVEAVRAVRDETGRRADVRGIFRHVGEDFGDRLRLEAEMVVPEYGVDDLGQEARASTTFLRYTLVLAYRRDEALPSLGSLEILQEALERIALGEASKHLLFLPSKEWRKSAVRGSRASPFISTDGSDEDRAVRLHQERRQGRTLRLLARNLPRTVLSTTNAAENPTAFLARREMRSWRTLQLEPSALRSPDSFEAPPHLGADGSHLPATLYRLARVQGENGQLPGAPETGEPSIYGQVASRLASLIDDVYAVGVDRDERRELLTLVVTDQSGTAHAARALSDGTLRFLALAVLDLDPEAQGLLCLEEPENGVHPERIPAMLRLLQDLATDIESPLGDDNPLRQVIVNTHSPVVVQQVPDDALLVALAKQEVRGGRRFGQVTFAHLKGTWRDRPGSKGDQVSLGDLMSYLNPVPPALHEPATQGDGGNGSPSSTHRRVVDRPDVQLLLPLGLEQV